MKISTYFEALNKKANLIFSETIEREEDLASVHDLAAKLFHISKLISDKNERELIATICSQLEASCLNLAFGLYRQALSSLRLSFELGLGEIYFSANKLEYREWQHGVGDIKWSKLIDEDNGVLSKRFVKAFHPNLQDTVPSFRSRAIFLYRTLSEYVHGNSDTWKECGMVLERNLKLEDKYFQCFKEVSEILFFSIFCRYASDFNGSQIDEISDAFENLNHIAAVREFLGGPKDIL